ncbi:suppressor of tub2 mutation [Cytospora paraplurivora]|uniref:Suppressor of tub2 mutation n=1 Tax=Cytospora paraplurivora TaxID=2898453 RepID=A0AAN9UB98_9PEZI
MAERITDEQVEALQKVLRSDASVDAKVAQVTAVKTGIKHHNVPDTCVAELFEALRTASSSQHAVLVNAGLTSLNHLLTRISRQEPKFITREAKVTLPFLTEKLGDQKEKFRSLAVQSLATMYKVVPVDVERHVRNLAMSSKNPKAKEASLQWLLQMHQEQGLQFRTYVPRLMELLEDADASVREAAKTTVIELFKNSPGTAKVDLKKQLENFKVRPAIKQAIVKELVPRARTPAPDEHGPAETAPGARSNLAASVSSLSSSERPITPMPEMKMEPLEPSYLNTLRELDEMFGDMHGYFDGRESEHNWMLREQSINRLRRLMAGNAVSDFHDPFLAGLRSLLDGIIKAVTSLRTSLSKEGCALVQEIAINYGPGMDPMVELLMQTCVKLSANTKKIASLQGNACVEAIISKVTYTNRILQHVAGACTDKNLQPRLYATVWLKTLLTKEAHHKSHIEHTGGLDLIEKSIKKGLNDPNPGVREKMRPTFWTFYGIWPARADALMDTLEPTAQRLLERDPNNPNTPKKPEPTARAGLGFSRSATGTKPSLKETMMAQKRAMASKNLPVRPGSAMAHFSPSQPSRAVSGSSTAPGGLSASSTATRQKVAVGAGGGLSGAPVRPSRRRPEMAPRPATAGPYSVRGELEAEPLSPPPRAMPRSPTPKAAGARSLSRPRSSHKHTSSQSSIPTPTRLPQPKSPAASPVKSPSRPRLQPGPLLTTPKTEENFATLPPALSPAGYQSPVVSSPRVVPIFARGSADRGRTDSPTGSPSKALRVFEDPVTASQSYSRRTSPAVLEEKPVNEGAATLLARQNGDAPAAGTFKSTIAKIEKKTLRVDEFKPLQSSILKNKALLPDDTFRSLLSGLFEYLKDEESHLAPEKLHDVKVQILATIKLLLKKQREHFRPYISDGLKSLMSARRAYDARDPIVFGLELLADEMVTLGDAQEIALVLTQSMYETEADDAAAGRSLSMGLHVLKEMVDARTGYIPTDQELRRMSALCARCLESSESGVRMDAVQFCVALHSRVGDTRFWAVMKDVKDDPKSLITYYIVKRQREVEANGRA